MVDEQLAKRIVIAFEVVRTGIVPHDACTEQGWLDVEWLDKRYDELRDEMDFGSAMRQAQTEFILMVCNAAPAPSVANS